MSKIKIETLLLGHMQTNGYFLYHEDVREAIIIDPADRTNEIVERLEQLNLKPCAILLTHGHFDHILSVADIKEKYDILVYSQLEEKEVLGDSNKNLSVRLSKAVTISPDVLLKDGEEIVLGQIPIRVIHTPGHTIGSTCYYVESADILVSGDTLFYEEVGRCDLPTSNFESILHSIREKLFVLKEETRVYPGHDKPTTIGHEKKYNPFCQ